MFVVQCGRIFSRVSLPYTLHGHKCVYYVWSVYTPVVVVDSGEEGGKEENLHSPVQLVNAVPF